MPPTDQQKKGDDLEKAVQLIETVILGSNPATKNAIITIEPKKIVVVDSVKHEIDIFITIDYGKGYKAIFIFECKNWEQAVNKNELIVFSEKIRAVQAQKGYFIAKSFGRYAVAQAKKDGRIELLTASSALDILPPFVENFHIIQNLVTDSHLSFTMMDDDSEQVKRFVFHNESPVRYKAEELLLAVLHRRLQKLTLEEAMLNIPSDTLSEGVNRYERTRTLHFQPNEMVVEGIECSTVTIHMLWESRIIHHKIVSKFDVKKRGRVITIESDRLATGTRIRTSFIGIV